MESILSQPTVRKLRLVLVDEGNRIIFDTGIIQKELSLDQLKSVFYNIISITNEPTYSLGNSFTIDVWGNDTHISTKTILKTLLSADEENLDRIVEFMIVETLIDLMYFDVSQFLERETVIKPELLLYLSTSRLGNKKPIYKVHHMLTTKVFTESSPFYKLLTNAEKQELSGIVGVETLDTLTAYRVLDTYIRKSFELQTV